ncbi:MAG: helix-turn-helix domain-containing protein [Syntrophobacteraceae bacterium]
MVEDRVDVVKAEAMTMKIFVKQNGQLIPDRDVLRAKELLTIEQAAAILNISTSKIYEMFRPDREDLEAVKFGRSVRIKTRSLLRLLERK